MKNAKITVAVTFATLCGIASACGTSNVTPSSSVKSTVGNAAANASKGACSIDGPREQLRFLL